MPCQSNGLDECQTRVTMIWFSWLMRYFGGEMMKRHFTGITNSLMGVALAFVAGWYAEQMTDFSTLVIGASASVLILRECWAYGGKARDL